MRQPRKRLTRLAPLAAAAALMSTGCSAGGIHASALQRSVGTAYQRLYLLQQRDLGHTVTTAADSTAHCTRTGSTATSGAGSWTCTLHFPYADGHLIAIAYDVEVQPIGCYTATGPPSVVGQVELGTPSGGSVTNPLFAFDGCFRPG